MKIRIFGMAIVMILAWALPVRAQPGNTLNTLNILSWNIYMLPRFAKITGKRQRAHAIATQLALSDAHVVVFQEAFLGDARRIIRKGLQEVFPYAYGPANKKFSIRTNSGIWILSRMPLEVLGELAFSDCAGFDDCMARKGALLVRGEYAGKPFQVLGTHLQAGGPDSIRRQQIRELAGLLQAQRRPQEPQIVAGDMNTAKADAENYPYMLRVLDAVDGRLDVEDVYRSRGWPNDMRKGPRRHIIDFIFVRENGCRLGSVRRTIPEIRQRWHRRHQDLSDHPPIELRMEIAPGTDRP